MFNKINEFKDSLKALKELEKNISNLDMSDPEGFLKDMGIDIDELDERFEESIQPNLVLKYVNKSENQEPEYAYPTDSGFDLRANETVTLKPLHTPNFVTLNHAVPIPIALKVTLQRYVFVPFQPIGLKDCP